VIAILLSKFSKFDEFDEFDVKQDRYVEINLHLLFDEKHPCAVT